MANAGRDTDERLRSYLPSQPDQERLCIGLVSLVGGFYNIAPRRPLGGPDGSRDIQAVAASNGDVTWFAVGFVHGANDTDAQRRQVIAKCRSDLDEALVENPSLKAFGFFTNVDTKPAEERDLRTYASTKGIVWFEVYNRERVRSLLDSPQGYGLRLEFLNIAMEKEQQLAWLATHHVRLEQLEGVTRRMELMLMRQERLRNVAVVANFARASTSPPVVPSRSACSSAPLTSTRFNWCSDSG